MDPVNDYSAPSSRRAALAGALPFLAYGLVNLLGKLTFDRIPPAIYLWMGLYGFILTGLLVGWVRGFPRWAYAYPGWALLIAWYLSNIHTPGLKVLGHTLSFSVPWGWLALDALILVALACTRSLRPVKQFFTGIWNDWTRLSLILFVIPAWLACMYDENHSPYLLVFMLGSTLAVTSAAYIYARLSNSLSRILSLVTGMLVALGLNWVCDSTWDFAAYYHLPPSSEPWYMAIFRWSIVLAVIALFLIGPALLSLLRKGIGRSKT